jgi:hypothetical protein
MNYLIIENGVVTNIAASDPEFAASQGWIEHPGTNKDGVLIDKGFLYQNGDFVEPPRNIEFEWQQVRVKRNALLALSDISVLPDRWAVMTTEKQTAWSTYRQSLRDITTTFSDPKDVVWPEAPV